MTVEFAELPYDLLRTISNRIIAETPHVNRVMFDITDKPRERLSGNNCIPEKAQSYQGFFAMSARCGNKMATLFELLR